MKASELRQKNVEELAKLLEEKRAKLAELRFDLEGGKTKNLKEFRVTRLDIARIQTLVGQARKI